MLKVLLILPLLVLACLPQKKVSYPEHRTLIKTLSSKTVRVQKVCSSIFGERKSRGSGVSYVSNSHLTKIITAAHVTEAPKGYSCSYIVISSAGDKHPAYLIKEDLKKDLSILVVLTDLKKNTTISEDIYLGQRVIAVGFPHLPLKKGVHLSVTEGVLASIVKGKHRKMFRITAAIYSGSSGCGIWNSSDELVGIAVEMVTNNGVPMESQYWAVSAETILEFLKD